MAAEGVNKKYRTFESPVANEVDGVGKGFVRLLAAIPAGVYRAVQAGEEIANKDLNDDYDDLNDKRFKRARKFAAFSHGRVDDEKVDINRKYTYDEDVTGSNSERVLAMFATGVERTALFSSLIIALLLGGLMKITRETPEEQPIESEA